MNIQELLQKQNAMVAEMDFTAEIAELDEIGVYNQEIFNRVKSAFENVDKEIKVWEEFSFGSVSGKILGFLRTIFFNFKHRDELCSIIGISSAVVDKYLQYAGNAPYIAKDGSIIDAKPMDIENSRKLVAYVANKLQIVCQEDDLMRINEDSEKRRNELLLQNAIKTRDNSSIVSDNLTVNINNKNIYNGAIDA